MFLVLNSIAAWIIAISLVVGITLCYEAGALVGTYQKRKNPDAKAEGLGPLEGSLLGLFALLLSFTFNMSASRYDARRSVIIEEANNMGTAILRADMYPDSIRTLLRNDFQQYVEARIAYYSAGADEEKISKTLTDAATISDRIWQRVTLFSRGSSTALPHALMLPALNDMIDIVTSRDAIRKGRVPQSVIWLLIILSLLGSSIIGYSKKEKKNDWIVLFIYSLMTVITLYTIIDLDRPRRGLIKTDLEHQKIVELRNLFKSSR